MADRLSDWSSKFYHMVTAEQRALLTPPSQAASTSDRNDLIESVSDFIAGEGAGAGVPLATSYRNDLKARDF